MSEGDQASLDLYTHACNLMLIHVFILESTYSHELLLRLNSSLHICVIDQLSSQKESSLLFTFTNRDSLIICTLNYKTTLW